MFWGYFKTEFKNSIVMIKKQAIAYLLIILALTAVFAAVSFAIGKNETPRIKTAVVMPDDDKLTQMMIRYISQMESVNSMTDFVYMSKDEAFKSLDTREINVVIELPPDFYDNVNNGYNTPLDIYVRNDADGLNKGFIQVIKSGSGYVRTTEAAVYSFLSINRSGEYEVVLKNENIGDHIAYVYANLLMHRTRLFTTTIISEFGEVNGAVFYFWSGFLIVMLYICLSFGYLYRQQERSIEKKLVGFNISSLKISVIKEFIMSLHLTVAGILLCAVSLYAAKRMEITLFEPHVWHIFLLWFISFALAGMFDMIYSFSGNDYGVMATLLSVSVLMVICAGMIIPVSILSNIPKAIGYVDPLKYMFAALIGISVNSLSVTIFASLALIILIEHILGCLCKRFVYGF